MGNKESREGSRKGASPNPLKASSEQRKEKEKEKEQEKGPISWEATLREQYPLSLEEEDFVVSSHKALDAFGFSSENTLACVSVCRDEMCLPFVDLVDEKWKYPFTSVSSKNGAERTIYAHAFCMSSLAGMLFLGKTGLGAAISHATRDPKDGRRRYAFFVFAHIGLSGEGVVGEVERPGFLAPSHACGALKQFHEELRNGFVDTETMHDDIEYTIMKQRLFKKLRVYGSEPPTIQYITEQTYHVILEDLESLITKVIDTATCDYAVLSGVLVHGPSGQTYICPGTNYAVVNAVKRPLELHH